MARMWDLETSKQIGAEASDEVILWRAASRFGEYKLVSIVVLSDGRRFVVDFPLPLFGAASVALV